MHYNDNWAETKERFLTWWNRGKTDRPLACLAATRKKQIGPLEEIQPVGKDADLYLDVERLLKQFRNYLRTHKLYADAYASFSANIGPGSMALYLGSEPIFSERTVWFEPCVESWDDFGPLRFDPDNSWWQKHLQMISTARAQSNGDFIVDIPDIVENVDILSAMRGPHEFCFDLIDQPELMKKYIDQIDSLYFRYYDAMYDTVKLEDGSCSYTAFQIWGPGKTAKVQCDFAALMSPNQFREFVQPSLRKQCSGLDYSLYHLDGPDAVKHLDALMEIEELDALQWTPGAGKPDGGDESWFHIYDKVKAAGKSLWLYLQDGGVDGCIARAKRIIERYGNEGLYLLFTLELSEEEADEVMAAITK